MWGYFEKGLTDLGRDGRGQFKVHAEVISKERGSKGQFKVQRLTHLSPVKTLRA